MSTETSGSKSSASDSIDTIERLRTRVDVLEKRLWDLEVAMEQLTPVPVPSPTSTFSPAETTNLNRPSSAEEEKEPEDEPFSSITEPPDQSSVPVNATTRVPVAESQPFEVIEVDGRMTGESEQGFDYVWQITVHSRSDRNHKLRARVCFVDLHSQVLDEVVADGLMLFAGRKQKFTGKHSIGHASHDQITGIKAHLDLDEN